MEDFPGAAKGYASFQEQRIVIRPGMSQMQTIKTLVHEIAHAKLHDPAHLSPEERKQRREKEVEAESVAYVVANILDWTHPNIPLAILPDGAEDENLPN